MKLFKFTLAIATAVAIVGCNSGSNTAGSAGDSGGGDKLSVGIVFDKGGLGDKSFNDSAWRGVQRAKEEFGIEVIDRSSPTEKDFETNLSSLARRDLDLIIGVGINMQAAMEKVSKEHPDMKFAIVDAPVEAENVRSLLFKEEEGSFLAGYLAGLMTKTNKIGFVGGMEIPLIKKFEAGYIAGAKTANPNVEVLPSKYTGDWNDAGIAKEAANGLYAAGADIIYHAAGRAGLGVFEAAAAKQLFAIGVDSDQDDIQEGLVLTSMIKRVDEAVYQTIEDLKEGNFSGGSKVYDLKVNGVGLSEMRFTKDKIGEENLKKIEDVKQQIVDGKIVVPTDQDTLQQYLSGLAK